jgi:hypothetical protein
MALMDNGPEGAGVPSPDALPMPQYRSCSEDHGCVLAVLKTTDVFWVLVLELPEQQQQQCPASLIVTELKDGPSEFAIAHVSRIKDLQPSASPDTIWVKPGLLQGVPHPNKWMEIDSSYSRVLLRTVVFKKKETE